MLRRTFVILALMPLTGGCQKPPLQEFTSTEYKFKASFPGIPRRENKTGALGTKFAVYGTSTEDGICKVEIAEVEIPDDASDALVEDWVEGAVKAAIRDYEPSLKGRSRVVLSGKFPGREFLAGINKPFKGEMRGRIYLVNKRLYQVIVIGSGSYASSDHASQFLDSFQLIP